MTLPYSVFVADRRKGTGLPNTILANIPKHFDEIRLFQSFFQSPSAAQIGLYIVLTKVAPHTPLPFEQQEAVYAKVWELFVVTLFC